MDFTVGAESYMVGGEYHTKNSISLNKLSFEEKHLFLLFDEFELNEMISENDPPIDEYEEEDDGNDEYEEE